MFGGQPETADQVTTPEPTPEPILETQPTKPKFSPYYLLYALIPLLVVFAFWLEARIRPPQEREVVTQTVVITNASEPFKTPEATLEPTPEPTHTSVDVVV